MRRALGPCFGEGKVRGWEDVIRWCAERVSLRLCCTEEDGVLIDLDGLDSSLVDCSFMYCTKKKNPPRSEGRLRLSQAQCLKRNRTPRTSSRRSNTPTPTRSNLAQTHPYATSSPSVTARVRA